ncbi:MAG: hypothetical protein HOC71_07625 [Candidatus Latescibacteria bacterium]|nr:hypothetical protein [Candidatus Latescibacterota bacterium]
MKQYLILFFTVLFVCGIRGAPLSMKGESVEITRDIVVFENNLQKCLDKTIEETPKLLQQRQEELKDRYLVEFQDRFDDHLLRLYAEAPEISQTRKNSESSPSGRRHGSKSRLMVMYRLIDYLDLDEETETKFLSAHLDFTNKHDKFHNEHRELIKTIAEQADDENVTVSDLKKKVERLKFLEKSKEAEREKFLKKSKKILDERQYIKLIVFNDKFKQDLIARFRSDRNSERSRKNIEEDRKNFEEWIKAREKEK